MVKKIAIFLIIISASISSFSQDTLHRIALTRSNKSVMVLDGLIGLTTNSEAIAYNGEKELSYKIQKITTDSLYVAKPLVYQYALDTLDNSGYSKAYAHPNRFLKRFRKNKKEYHAYIAVDTLQIKAIAYQDIMSISYPPEASNNTGCIMCVFAFLIPGVNVWVYYKLRKRWHPKTYDLTKWKLNVERITIQ